MIEINNYWQDEIKSIVTRINQAIRNEDSKMFRGMVLELMKMLNNKHPSDIRSSAAWAFVDISENHPEELRNIIPSVIDLLDDPDTFIKTYAINTLENLYEHHPMEVTQCIPNLQECVSSFDTNLRKVTLSFIDVFAEDKSDSLPKYDDLIDEIKLTTKDLDSTVANTAKRILNKIEN